MWLAGTAVLVAVLAGRIALHAEGANGPRYWRWRWENLDSLRVYPAMAIGLLPFVAAQWWFARGRRVGVALALLMASTLLFALANTAIREPDLSVERPISVIVENHVVMGYLTDARRFNQESCVQAVLGWLHELPERSPSLSLHGRNKPPGAVLYFTVMLHLLGRHTALVAGLLVGMVSLFAIPACFALLRTLGLECTAAFHGASYLALCPGLIVFFPQFDPLYALFSAVLLTLWVAAVDRRRTALAVTFGLSLAAFCFFTYNLLVLGAFVAAYWAWRVASGTLPLKTGLRQAGVALLTVVGVYGLLWVVTDYHAIRAFLAAYGNQQTLAHKLARPYPASILHDLVDFMRGAAYVAGVLVVYALVHLRLIARESPRHAVLMLLCLGQIVLVAVIGLLQTETLRVWAFLLPLLMFPCAVALGHFSGRGRLLFYAAAWVVLAVMCQNMQFMRYRKRKRRPASASLVARPVAVPAEAAMPHWQTAVMATSGRK